jgi:hypothetical protein
MSSPEQRTVSSVAVSTRRTPSCSSDAAGWCGAPQATEGSVAVPAAAAQPAVTQKTSAASACPAYNGPLLTLMPGHLVILQQMESDGGEYWEQGQLG